MKLDYDAGREMAWQYFRNSSLYLALDEEAKRKVSGGGTVEKQTIKYSFLIPGERPELGVDLMILAIDRNTGHIREITKDEYFEDDIDDHRR